MKLTFLPVMFGADPEFFFTKDGQIVGAEKILPKGGLDIITDTRIEVTDAGQLESRTIKETVVVIDGVQAELNVMPAACRQTFSNNLASCLALVHQTMKEQGVTADFSQTVPVDKKELESLSEESQRFGCAPSHNAYGGSGIKVEGSTYYKRSAGGHLHLGHCDQPDMRDLMVNNTGHLVKMLDILVGNTCVLLDRDEGNVERRKHYGRAGEYRLPEHGIEYRTLSNFWLKSYPLTSFVLAMARFAILVAMDPKLSKTILKKVDMNKVRDAINNNDFVAAYNNFNEIKGIISKIGADEGWPLGGARMKQFEYFVQQGMSHWFKEDPMVHWLRRGFVDVGWENFLYQKVRTAMNPPKPINHKQLEYTPHPRPRSFLTGVFSK